ncbi:secretogranin_V domain-containing protein 7B2 [Calliopsis andreniformis]|uniref:secretogranin_V domain-containing protein 7B2 n=1 Tax=Calliopsis andreniformis TaxID=337506 RepID=UPI003FCCA528
MYWISFLLMAVAAQATMYMPPSIKEEQFLTDALLRDLISQMNNEFVDAADSYLEYHDKAKEIPIELPADYDGIDTLNPNPSIRDQEYLQHSTLWSHQRLNNNINKGPERQKVKIGSLKNLKEEKAENALPAYCTPPNPCPVGYSSENNCIVDFENTEEFSRDYQSSQDCMCDKEHMFNCPVDSNSNSLPSVRIPNANFNQIVDQFQAEENPFFRGEKLPIAAKKGINVVY